ncbi:MAG: cold shock and DUF1294 domain-containing protein [Chamaesiphon sp.]|nr:cold shock and DUF1294 domain-containing protein [Chamaesiphon sp.]
MTTNLRSGRLTKWNDEGGFGFIQPIDKGQTVYLHISEIKDSTRRPQLDDTIYYYMITEEDGKLRADNAFILGARRKTTSLSRSLTDRETSPFPIQIIVLLSILPLVGSIHFFAVTRNPLPFILYPVMSVLTYALYANDKSRAKRGNWRIPEKSLHLCEFAGRWLGGFVAQRRLDHKSTKKSYQLEFWMIVIIHQIGYLCCLFLVK